MVALAKVTSIFEFSFMADFKMKEAVGRKGRGYSKRKWIAFTNIYFSIRSVFVALWIILFKAIVIPSNLDKTHKIEGSCRRKGYIYYFYYSFATGKRRHSDKFRGRRMTAHTVVFQSCVSVYMQAKQESHYRNAKDMFRKIKPCTFTLTAQWWI